MRAFSTRRLRGVAVVLLFGLAVLGFVGGSTVASHQLAQGLGHADDAGPTPASDAIGVLCHARGPLREPPGVPHHAPMDCALCPLCTCLGATHALMAPPSPFPAPVVIAIIRPGAPPGARAPPSRVTAAAYPRGPPALI